MIFSHFFRVITLCLLVLTISCATTNMDDGVMEDGPGLTERPNNPTCVAPAEGPAASNIVDTGCFTSESPLQTAGGLIPYSVNFPFWSDGAIKERWLAIPDGTTVSIDENGDWEFPVGTVLVKNFTVEGQLIETRLFMQHSTDAWAGYSYEWNETATSAAQVPPSGKVRTLGNGQEWLYPGRTQCLRCHTQVAKRSLGLENGQMNRLFTYPSTGKTDNQINTLASIGILASNPGDPNTLTKFFPWEDSFPTVEETELAARSYLHANCSFCHQPNGPGGGGEDFRFSVSFEDMNVCGIFPSFGDFGLTDPSLLSPGQPDQSIIFFRLQTLGSGRMPPLASSVVDTQGVDLIADWISSISSCP